MQRAVDIALTQIGVREASGQNDGVPAVRYNRGDKLPWCAAFALWCNEQSDEERIPRNTAEWYAARAVQGFEDLVKARGWWLPPDTVPQRGDYVFYAARGGSDAGGGRHMGIVQTVSDGPYSSAEAPKVGTWLTTVEGNLGDRVKTLLYRRAAPPIAITGYARVPLASLGRGSTPSTG